VRIIKNKITVCLIFFLFIFLIFSSTVTLAKNETEEEQVTAEINVDIEGDIPSINVSEWTPITIQIKDAFGLNWTRLQQKFPFLYMKLVWPFMFGPKVNDYLGYTSLVFEPEIYSGRADGWNLKIEPSTIPGTTGGQSHKITLYAQVDELAVDYSVVIGVKCTRFLATGEEYGSSIFFIPVKASAFNYVQMYALNSKKTVPPRSITDMKVQVINKGFYPDVFRFKVKSKDNVIGVVTESGLYIKPGETKTITVNVLTPDIFFDPGTPHKLDLYVSSINDPTETYIGSILVRTQGFHISPLVILVLVIIIILIVVLFFSIKKLKIENTNILIKNKKKIKTEKETTENTDTFKDKISSLFKKEPVIKKAETIEKTKEIKLEKEKPVVEEKIKEKPVEEKPKPLVDKRKEKELRKKERLLLKLKREQEKQRKKT